MGHIDQLLYGENLVDNEQEFYWLWLFAIATYGVGDIVTTITILEFDVGVNEANLFLQHVFDSLGQMGLIGLKMVVFFLCLGVSMVAVEYWDDWLMYYAPPLILVGLGSFVSANNLYLLLA